MWPLGPAAVELEQVTIGWLLDEVRAGHGERHAFGDVPVALLELFL